ncbi:MAG: SDR family NAD(P)-dependent oxidoreductase, partial [Anaerolineales bacterium]|nr:SDR family NAD(P)-dependent oxidoreductase [Anaerolineales bacterium]
FVIAEGYLREGATVVLSSRSPDSVRDAVNALREKGYECRGIVCDVQSLQSVDALARFALSQFDKIDIWVNNAGIAGTYGPTIDIPMDRFNSVLQTNIMGVYYGSTIAMRHFLDHNQGKLINVLGHGAREIVPFQNAYASSKGWIRKFSLTLAKEYTNTNVGVYTFHPGMVDTELLRTLEVVEGWEQRLQPFKFFIRIFAKKPKDIVEKAIWLASSATDGRTGLEVRVSKPASMIGRVIKEGINRLLQRPVEEVELKITSVPSSREDTIQSS